MYGSDRQPIVDNEHVIHGARGTGTRLPLLPKWIAPTFFDAFAPGHTYRSDLLLMALALASYLSASIEFPVILDSLDMFLRVIAKKNESGGC